MLTSPNFKITSVRIDFSRSISWTPSLLLTFQRCHYRRVDQVASSYISNGPVLKKESRARSSHYGRPRKQVQDGGGRGRSSFCSLHRPRSPLARIHPLRSGSAVDSIRKSKSRRETTLPYDDLPSGCWGTRQARANEKGERERRSDEGCGGAWSSQDLFALKEECSN